MVEQRLIQSQTLRQEQILSANQIQSLDILMSPILELQTKISEELELNPVLEQDKDTRDNLDDLELARDNSNSLIELGEPEAEDLKDDDFDNFSFLSESWHDYLPSINTGASQTSDEEKHAHFFNSLIDTPTVEHDLMEQINFLNLDTDKKQLCELIIGSLDEQGYFRTSLADLAVMGGSDTEEMEDALMIVQGLEPAGVAARNLRECLRLQLERSNKGNKAILVKLVTDHLEDIAANHLPLITRKMNITLDELKGYLTEIKKLNPNPYRGMSAGNDSMFIVPEISIVKKEGEYTVILNKEYQPRLRISEHYLSILEDSNTSKETKDYIKQKIISGNNIIKSIEQRQETIRKLVEVIIDSQYEFLENGVEHLVPMTMKQVADKIGVHETTVSRAVSNKYVTTPQGTFGLKFFFSTGFQSADGDMISNKSVMEKIRDIVDSEDKSKPLSDDEIRKILNEDGIPVARRTVAKYREETGIPSSRLRKEFS